MGHLVYQKTRKRQQQQRPIDRLCLWRTNNDTSVELSSCDVDDERRRLVNFSLVRFQAAANATQLQDLLGQSATAEKAVGEEADIRVPLAGRESRRKKEEIAESEVDKPQHIPTTRDLAHTQASVQPSKQKEQEESTMKPHSQMLKATGPTIVPKKKKTPLLSLKDTNPILFLGGEDIDENVLPAQPQGVGATTTSLHAPSQQAVYKTAKIQPHPYLQTAKNEVWEDPQTGLEYRTDLCGYLGHTRKEAGRHTLVGVGQYMRTVFNVKVRTQHAAFVGFVLCESTRH